MPEKAKGYRPGAGEPYMSDRQLRYFKRRLQLWKEELLAASRETIAHLRAQSFEVGDEADESSRIESQQLELRTRDRYRKLIAKIDQALERIRDGSYGYCEMTGEPIGLARLEARPIANLSVDAQERKEVRDRAERYDRVFLPRRV